MKKYLNDLSFKDLVATFYDKTEIHFANGLNQQRFLGKKSTDNSWEIIPLKLMTSRETLAAHSRTQMCQVCTVSGQCTAANSMDPIHFGLNMHCILKDVDVNFLESFKGLYFLHYPHFPLPCCVLSSPHTMLANHVFWTVMCPIFYSSKRQRYHSVVQQSKCIYYIHSSPPFSALHNRALTIQLSMRVQSHFTTQQDGKTEYQRCTYSNGHSPISLKERSDSLAFNSRESRIPFFYK